MKVLYLFNKVLAQTIEDARQGRGHDSWCFGMLRLPKYGVEADYLELEKFIPSWLALLLRRSLLTMHYAHLPLFPLFFRYDVVFTSTAYASLILKAALGIKKFKWVILDFNVLGTIGDARKLRQRIYAWAVAKADGVVCISAAARDAMKHRFPHLADRIIFLHEATDPDYFKPAIEPIASESPVVISVGNYGRDFETVIAATEGLGVRCLLATKLISADQAKLLPAHVTVGLFNHAEMLAAYRQATIAVVAIAGKDDYCDSVGTFALGEAMSMGKATIVTRTKNMESYVIDGQNGIFVPHKDVRAMRAKIAELLRNSGLRHRMGEQARKFAVERLDPERFAAALAAYLKKL